MQLIAGAAATPATAVMSTAWSAHAVLALVGMHGIGMINADTGVAHRVMLLPGNEGRCEIKASGDWCSPGALQPTGCPGL